MACRRTCVKIGLVGAGDVGEYHLRGYLDAGERVAVTAVADTDLARAKEIARRAGGADVYESYRELLLAADVDAIDICLPHNLHADAIAAAADAGKHILCEKPLCVNMAEADRIRQCVAINGVTMMSGHDRLFKPSVATALELIRSRKLGQIYELETKEANRHKMNSTTMGWRSRVATSGGGELLDMGWHQTYLLLHLAQDEPVEVAAMVSTHRLTFSEGEDSARVLVRFASGMVGSIVSSWAYDPVFGGERFSVFGDEGALTATDSAVDLKLLGQPIDRIELAPAPTLSTIRREISHFLDCLESGQKPIQTEADGIAVLKVILAAYRSAREKRIVRVADA